MPEFRTNVSSINDYMQCRYRWIMKWVLNRVPRFEARALSFGKLLHLVFEDHALSGDPMDVVIARQRARWLVEATIANKDLADATTALNAIADLDSYTEVLCMWKDQYPFDIPVLEAEQAFEIRSPFSPPECDIILIGRPDRVGVCFGRTFHVQNRSLASTSNFDLYMQLAKRSLHELLYGFHLSRKYNQYNYGGTIFNLLRKVAYRGKPTAKNPEGKILRPINECLWQGMCSFSNEELDAGVRRATQWASDMYRTACEFQQSGTTPLPNEILNGGPYKNSIDPYFSVLQGDINIMDDKHFKDREDLYA